MVNFFVAILNDAYGTVEAFAHGREQSFFYDFVTAPFPFLRRDEGRLADATAKRMYKAGKSLPVAPKAKAA